MRPLINKQQKQKAYLNRGIGLLEIIIATAILGVALGSVVVTYGDYLKTALLNTDAIKATYLAEEGIEAVRFLRDTSWTNKIGNLTVSTNYFLNYATTTKVWSITAADSSNMIDRTYMRTVNFAPVYRDSGGQMVDSGGTTDANTRMVTVTVSWLSHGATTTKSLSAYIANLFTN